MDNATLKKIAANLEYLKAVSLRLDTDTAREIYGRGLQDITELIGDSVNYSTTADLVNMGTPLPPRPDERDQVGRVIRILRAVARRLIEENESRQVLSEDDLDFLGTMPRIRHQVR